LTTPATKNQILFALAMAQAPLTVQELCKRTGKSYNTVKAVVEDGRVTKLGKHPVRYHLAKPDQLDQEVIRVEGKQPSEGWVRWMQKVQPKLVRLTDLDSASDSSALKKQGMVLEALGINIVSLGRELQKNKDKPDWYELMGGTVD
jgi:hypothetical protein